MEEAAQPIRPTAARSAAYILYAVVAVGALRRAFEVGVPAPNLPTWFAPVVGSITLLFLAAIAFLIAQGRNWARILFLLLFIAGVPTMYAVASELQARLSGRPGATALLVLQSLAQLVATILLFTPASNSWFRAAKAHRRAG